MIRTLALTAALATASVVALASPASAQSYGGVTLSFGSGGYGGHTYDDDAYNRGGYYAYADPRYGGYDDERIDAWRAHERHEQIERWQREQERRRYWEHERREHQQWREHGDDD
ncbi:hypothetical protein [Sphingomonas sp. PAMC 26617]|uniref:hypothetical protein n=1 Tax=Sphingomonas sp. PAMC 26617 TaxID=1112216 RepID=UPI0002880E5E|nr:hypothetical protein [Sphingomonas sp. PAMC 26617]